VWVESVRERDSSLIPAQADIKSMLRVKESGLGDAWKLIWGTLQESLGCTSKCLLPFLHAALRLAVERRYILSSDRYVYCLLEFGQVCVTVSVMGFGGQG